MSKEAAAFPRIPLTLSAVVCALGFALLLSADWLGDFTVPNPANDIVSFPVRPAVVGTILTYLVFAVFARHLRPRLLGGGPMVILLVSTMACLGRVLESFIDASVLGGALSMVGTLVQSSCEAVMLLCWIALACTFEPRIQQLLFPAAYAATAGLYFAASFLDVQTATLFVTVLPLLSGVTFAVTVRMVYRESFQTTDEDAEESAVQPETWTFPIRPVALMAVYGTVFYFSLSLSGGPSAFGSVGMLAVSALAILVAALFPRWYSPNVLYKCALPLLVVGVLVLAFIPSGRTAGVLFGNGGNVAFTLFILVSVGTMCYRYGIEPLWVFGIVEIGARCANLVGRPLGTYFTDTWPVGTETCGIVVLCVVAGLIVLSTIFFSEREAQKAFGMVPVSHSVKDGSGEEVRTTSVMTLSEALVWKAAQAARAYGLTQREQEIVELMLQGLSLGDIADKTCVSYGTVKTHVNHIYRKLDVHSRDEAVARMEGLVA